MISTASPGADGPAIAAVLARIAAVGAAAAAAAAVVVTAAAVGGFAASAPVGFSAAVAAAATVVSAYSFWLLGCRLSSVPPQKRPTQCNEVI